MSNLPKQMKNRIKKIIYKMFNPFIRIFMYFKWNSYIRSTDEINLVVGAGHTKYKGWFSTDISTLDITKEIQFKSFFSNKKINKILAEHVLEHLSDNEMEITTKNMMEYSTPKVNIRIAVPDGYHTDKNYINQVKPGGTGSGADDHKQLFNYKSLSDYFTKVGFVSYPLDYWDEDGRFHQNYRNDDKGYVFRSYINDKRNIDGIPVYTSLIIDFRKD